MEEKVIGLAKGTQRDSTRSVTPPQTQAMKDRTGLLVLTQFLFGFSYVPSKIIVAVIPPLLWVTLRTWITALIIGLLAWAWRGAPPRMPIRDVGILFGLALVGGSLNQAMFLVGLEKTTTGNSAVLSCLIPVFTVMLSIFVGKEKWTWNVGASFLAAFLGALLVVDVSRFQLSRSTVQGDILVILNAVSYALFLTFGGDFLRRYDRIWATAMLFTVGGFYLGLVSIPLWKGFEWPVFDLWLWTNAIYAVLGAVLIPYILVNIVLVSTPPSKVALFVFLQPVVAGVSGWLILRDPLTWSWAAGSLLVFAGVLLSHLKSLLRR